MIDMLSTEVRKDLFSLIALEEGHTEENADTLGVICAIFTQLSDAGRERAITQIEAQNPDNDVLPLLRGLHQMYDQGLERRKKEFEMH